MDDMTATAVLWGAPVPACYGMSEDGGFFTLEAQYGRPALLILAGARAAPRLAPIIAGLVSDLPAFAARGADILVVVNDNPAEVRHEVLASLPIPAVDCGSFLQRCGVGAQDVMVLLLDRALRVALACRPAGEPGLSASCLACLDKMAFEAARDIMLPAPAIVVPYLLAPALCRQLIDLFESSPRIKGEVARIDAAGRPYSVVDDAKKNRRDMMIGPETDLYKMLQSRILSLCRPEIARAFQANVTHIDRILLACYDETGGWFRRHRDNVAEQVAFREFALSLNLNTGEYDGGHLSFPEYNDHRYSPPAGAGVIFSTAVLHEAASVTAGRRYVLLTFLHGDAAEARRQAYLTRQAEAELRMYPGASGTAH